MNVDRETLMAYADGELDEAGRRRVELAIAADPELARQLDAERALKGRLRAHFAPIAEEPVPDAWATMIAAAARDMPGEKEAAPAPRLAPVVDLATARAARAARQAPPRRTGWIGLGIAASLVLGVMLGTQIRREGPVSVRDGTLVASAGLAHALDTQLASAQDGRPYRMLTSFRRASGDYCRVFAGGAMAGIACHDKGVWQLERMTGGAAGSGAGEQQGAYRQAGSAEAELMATAQTMASGEALDARAEAEARARGWK